MKSLSPEQVSKLSPERVLIAKILKKHIDSAIAELGVSYNVTVRGGFDKTPIRLEIEVTSAENEVP